MLDIKSMVSIYLQLFFFLGDPNPKDYSYLSA